MVDGYNVPRVTSNLDLDPRVVKISSFYFIFYFIREG